MSCSNAYGFRIVGDCRSERRLALWPAALAGYAACVSEAETDREAYLSAFMFGEEFKQRDNGFRVEVKGYDGPCGADWLWFDIDREGDLAAAQKDAQRLCAALVERYAIDGDDLLVFFSGSKGFHVGVPLSLCGSPAASKTFHGVARAFAEATAERLGITIDTGVYDRVRAFRAPNSRHPKTGLYKRWVSFDELLALRIEAIEKMAEAPEPFEVPESPPPHATAIEDWQQAEKDVTAKQLAIKSRSATAGAKLNRRTREFLVEGAETGDRHRLLFAAAANLGEFGCPVELAHELLTEPALDSGLAPKEVRRQIDCGLKHVSNKGQEVVSNGS